jgi:hypothetical protein
MKALILITFSLFLSSAFGAKSCKVYGISDGPQGLQCRFPDREVLLSCINGQYFLDRVAVSMAFHLEVESGTVPLVFKAPALTLTVVMDRPIEAELQIGKVQILGTCTKSF